MLWVKDVIKIREKENEQAVVSAANNDQELEAGTVQEEITEDSTTITQRVLDGQDSNYFPL